MSDLKFAQWAQKYDEEALSWPWGRMLEAVAQEIATRAPPRGVVTDWMCGTGYLLRHVAALRPDLRLTGIDANPHFIDYAIKAARKMLERQTTSDEGPWKIIRFVNEDVVSHSAPASDIAVSTGGLHHIKDDLRAEVLKKMWDSVVNGGRLIIADEILPSYDTALDRVRAVGKLYSQYARWMLEHPMPVGQMMEVVRLLREDLMRSREFKYDLESLKKIMPCPIERQETVWPQNASYGDVILVSAPHREISGQSLLGERSLR